jgi:hypothetical protein
VITNILEASIQRKTIKGSAVKYYGWKAAFLCLAVASGYVTYIFGMVFVMVVVV